MSTENAELIKKIKEFFNNEISEQNDAATVFSNDVINLAYQKISANLQDIIQSEDDPMVLSELLQNFLQVTKLVDERNLPKQQIMLKFFEQLTKYEQSRYH